MKIKINQNANRGNKSEKFKNFLGDGKNHLEGRMEDDFPRKTKKKLVLEKNNKEIKTERGTRFLDWMIKASIWAVVFLLPIFFLPIVPSPIEMNKQFLLIVLVGVGLLFWFGKMTKQNRFLFEKNFIFIPILTFLAVFALSSFFSSYNHRSIWGEFGGEYQSLVSVIFLIGFFFLTYHNIQTKKEIKTVFVFLLAGAFLVSIFGALQMAGKFLVDNEIAKSNYFNSIGSIYMFAIYVAGVLLLVVSLFLGNISKLLNVVLLLFSVLLFLILVVINFSLVWKFLIVGLIFVLGYAFSQSKQKLSQKKVLPMTLLVMALLLLLINKPIVKFQSPAEVFPNIKTSFTIMIKSWKSNFLLGSGPGSYQSVYQQNRPNLDGMGDFWAVDFTSGSSFLTTIGSTIGFLGIASLLFLILSGAFLVFRNFVIIFSLKDEDNFLVIGSAVMWIFLTAVALFYFVNLTILMLWWLSLAFLAVSDRARNRQVLKEDFSAKNYQSFPLSFGFVLLIIGMVTAVYFQSQVYLASAYFYKALVLDAKKESVESVVENLAKAIEFDPKRDVYYRNMSLAAFAIANKRVAEKGDDLSGEDSAFVSMALRDSLQSIGVALALSPKEAQNFITAGNIYEGLMATMEGAGEKAVENYQEALKISPNSPIILTKISQVYVSMAEIEKTKRLSQGKENTEVSSKEKEYLALSRDNIEKALQIKADYSSARLLLSSVYEMEGNLDGAIENEKGNKEIYFSDSLISFRLGGLYYKKEDYEKAREEFLDAIRKNAGEYANARYFLALTFDKLKEKDKAIEQLEKIVKDNSENEELKKMLDNLKAGRNIMQGIGNEDAAKPIAEEKVPPTEGGENENQFEIDLDFERQEIPNEALPEMEKEEEEE